MAKVTDLQPWIDYFSMLESYEHAGFLQTEPGRHEAYVTQPALHAMTKGDDPAEQLTGGVLDTVRRIRAYAFWKSCSDLSYTREPFAVHVVGDMEPHDPIYTVLLDCRRRWWWPFRRREHVEVISYR